jgi:hypothetical protein
MPARNNLAFDLGEDWLIALTCHQADGVTPIDLTGATVTMAVSGTTGFAPTITPQAPLTAGLVNIRVTSAQQAAAGIVASGSLSYTIRVLLADGSVSDQTAGLLQIRKTEF